LFLQYRGVPQGFFWSFLFFFGGGFFALIEAVRWLVEKRAITLFPVLDFLFMPSYYWPEFLFS